MAPRIYLKIIFLIVVACISGCGKKEVVYVAGDDFYQEVILSVEKNEVSVGEPVFLKVTRKSGGWVKTTSNPMNKLKCHWRNNEPPSYEEDVSWNIAFNVEPKVGVTFKVPENIEIDFNKPRAVFFEKSGVYKISGHSAVWCPPGMSTNEVIIKVN